MKQYLQDSTALSSETMQCQMLFEKVKDSQRPSVLQALLAAAVLEKFSHIVSKNYSAVFTPLKALLLRLIFAPEPDAPNSCESCFGAVPYFSLISYFARKVPRLATGCR